MPGRQSHGRSLMPSAPSGGAGAGSKSRQKSKAKSNKRSLNAFAEASNQYAEKSKRTPRNRELDAEISSGKHGRQDDDDDGDEDDEEERPRKMRRAGGDEDANVEYGSDSSGNEWRIGVAEDDDSDLDSDEAFGESDEERFEGYAFGGSSAKDKKKKKKAADSEDDEDDDEDDEDADGASLGSDAIDLAQALDMSMSEDDGPDEEEDESESGDDDGSDSAESGSSDDEEDSEVDEAGLKDFVNKFSGVTGDEDDEEEPAAPTKTKLDLKDLGLLGVKDPQLKQSVKLLTKEQKSSKPQKLEVPLARRAQDRVDRAAAYDKTNQTLDRWTETVKQNRRADHLVFPLPQTETGLTRHDNSEIRPITKPGQGTELEQSIFGLLEQSGLGPKPEQEHQNLMDDDDEAQTLSKKALWQEKRRERELKSREDARAKRLKKIKSKTFNRIHRKQREKEDMKEHEARLAAGEIDSDDDREMQDRQRAMERMGARHKESKWAKMANKNGRAAWDEDVRVGIADMARRDEELRRRVEGKPAAGSDDDTSDYDSGDEDDRKRILMDLDKADGDEDGPNSKLLNLPFMKKSEAAKKRANDDLVKQIRRELGSDDEGSVDSEQEGDVGRKTYGTSNGVLARPEKQKKAKASKEEMAEAFGKIVAAQNEERVGKQAEAAAPELVIKPTQGAWSAAPAEKSKKQRGKKAADSSVNVLDLDSSVAVRAPEPEVKPQPAQRRTITADDDESDDGERHMPIRFSERELLDKAFGGLDVVADFEKEKEELVEEQDEKMVDQTIPGWGSWVGEGVSEKEKKRHHGRFMKKQEGVKKSDRKDAKLKNVIVNEKRIKKNNKYLASQLPHQYESQAQYEGALRLPLGPNWVTKQTHQEATKPRVMVKQGIIAPMSKPMH